MVKLGPLEGDIKHAKLVLAKLTHNTALFTPEEQTNYSVPSEAFSMHTEIWRAAGCPTTITLGWWES